MVACAFESCAPSSTSRADGPAGTIGAGGGADTGAVAGAAVDGGPKRSCGISSTDTFRAWWLLLDALPEGEMTPEGETVRGGGALGPAGDGPDSKRFDGTTDRWAACVRGEDAAEDVEPLRA